MSILWHNSVMIQMYNSWPKQGKCLLHLILPVQLNLELTVRNRQCQDLYPFRHTQISERNQKPALENRKEKVSFRELTEKGRTSQEIREDATAKTLDS